MARLNTRASDLQGSRRESTRPPTRLGTESLVSGTDSDEENIDPSTITRDKGKGRADMPSQSRSETLPTPDSDSSDDSARGRKRKRGMTQPDEADLQERAFNRYFDPNQDPDIRRDIKRRSRLLEREFNETRDDLLRNNDDGLRQTIKKANNIYKSVKQTNDAISDSRLLVNVSDLANKKTAQLVLGDGSTGIDVDEFLSKFLSFGRHNASPDEENSTRAIPRGSRRRHRQDSEEEEDDDDVTTETLDWEYAGRMACLSSTRRPPVPSFLLGPLSVEKRQRAQTQRRARQTQNVAGREARPEALTRQDLQQSDENGLTAVCSRIRKHLAAHCQRAEATLQRAGFESAAQLNSEQGRKVMRKCRITATGGPSLFDYVVNPRSFGQTVENLFYVSFLIKEGAFGVQHDDDGLPTLVPSRASTLTEQRENKTTKRQAVFAIDYATWRNLIKAFEIRESMIEHRAGEESATDVGQRGWYS
nr:non-structural maintenance of chromosome element 4 [Quercus suber]